MHRAVTFFAFALLFFGTELHAADLTVGGGITRKGGGVLELGYSTQRWDFSLGYVATQTIDVIRVDQRCPAGEPWVPSCRQEMRGSYDVEPYVYASAQRMFHFRRDHNVGPFAGVGLVMQSETNMLVSSRLNISLSAGLRIGERWTVQLRHFSNADYEGPNLGQDSLVFAWKLQPRGGSSH